MTPADRRRAELRDQKATLERFAGQALAGLLANPNIIDSSAMLLQEQIVITAWRYAHEMVAQSGMTDETPKSTEGADIGERGAQLFLRKPLSYLAPKSPRLLIETGAF